MPLASETVEAGAQARARPTAFSRIPGSPDSGLLDIGNAQRCARPMMRQSRAFRARCALVRDADAGSARRYERCKIAVCRFGSARNAVRPRPNFDTPGNAAKVCLALPLQGEATHGAAAQRWLARVTSHGEGVDQARAARRAHCARLADRRAPG